MPRNLSKKDKEILTKLAPELTDGLCADSGHEYFSILPPVSNHFARDDRDFLERIGRLSREDLEYLAGLVLNGGESIGCVRPEHIVLFAEQVATILSLDLAEKIIEVYRSEGECE
jgi:hypothetical protein